MPSLTKKSTLKDYQAFVEKVYGKSNDRNFSSWDMLSNVQRFIMRGLKGIRKKNPKKIEENLIIALSWFVSLANQMHIDIETEAWKRFPGVCSYCGSSPCRCSEKKLNKRKKITAVKKGKVLSINNAQQMFEKIYPSSGRTLEDAGIHLAEEIGELSEAFLVFRGDHKESNFDNLKAEAADLLSCFMGVFNSLNINLVDCLAKMFSHNCHVCKKSPCECSFDFIVNYKS